MSHTAPLRLPQQPSKHIKLPRSTSTATSTTVVPALPKSSITSSALAPSLLPRTCSVCCRQAAVYTCPRCNVCSCSLDCYKQHSARCIHAFASQEEQRALKGARADDETKRDTLAMLQRVQRQQQADELPTVDSSDEAEQSEGEDEELARLLRAVGEDTLDLSSLSVEQQRHFLRVVHDGSLSRHIAIAVPWWLPKRARQSNETGQGQVQEARGWEPEMERMLVEEIEQAQSDEGQQTKAFIHSLPTLASLFAAEPSPALPYHLLELVYGSCYMYRLYNGEPHTDLPVFLADLATLSPSLTPSAAISHSHYQSTATTLQCCVARTRSLPSLYQSPQYSAFVLRDCSQLCLNTTLLFRLLRELCLWCESGGSGAGMKRVGKKVWFLCVWLQDRGVDVMRRVGEEARDEWKTEEALCHERGHS